MKCDSLVDVATLIEMFDQLSSDSGSSISTLTSNSSGSSSVDSILSETIDTVLLDDSFVLENLVEGDMCPLQ